MICGSISGNLHFVQGIMNRFQYVDILKENVKQSCVTLGIKDNFKFFQDNDAKH